MRGLFHSLSVFGAGLLFAGGLALGGMTMPHKVIGFLDLFGAWDPTLVAVMAGAVLTYGVLLRLVTRRSAPWFSPRFAIPTRRDLTPALVAGSALFGVGWGLAGFCPGPGVASLSTGAPAAVTFVAAMLFGMAAHKAWAAVATPAPRRATARGAE